MTAPSNDNSELMDLLGAPGTIASTTPPASGSKNCWQPKASLRSSC